MIALNIIPYLIWLIPMVVLIVILTITLLMLRKAKVKTAPKLDIEFLEQLYLALGGHVNIKALKSEHQRLHVEVNNIKDVDAQMLKTLQTPAFVKGKQITLLIKNHTQDVLSFINDKRKEEI